MFPSCDSCNECCFIHFPIDTPPAMMKLYPAGVTIIATCSGGQASEIERYGVSLRLINVAIDLMEERRKFLKKREGSVA